MMWVIAWKYVWTPPVLPDPVIAGDLFSEQIGFGAEAFWWLADALPANPAGLGLVVFGMEAAWANELPGRGDWFPFTRN